MNPEDTLRKHFEEMKRHDAAETPLFHQCLPCEKSFTRARPAFRIILFATAASVLLAAGVSFFHFRTEKLAAFTESNFEKWAALSNWEPYSDQLVTHNPRLPGNSLSAPTDTIFEDPTSTNTPSPNL
jgi:hypothetical protein